MLRRTAGMKSAAAVADQTHRSEGGLTASFVGNATNRSYLWPLSGGARLRDCAGRGLADETRRHRERSKFRSFRQLGSQTQKGGEAVDHPDKRLMLAAIFVYWAAERVLRMRTSSLLRNISHHACAPRTDL